MPATAREIARILDVQPVGENIFCGAHPETSLLTKVFGGQLFGQALASAARTVDPARPAHSLQALCLAPGRHDEPLVTRSNTHMTAVPSAPAPCRPSRGGGWC